MRQRFLCSQKQLDLAKDMVSQYEGRSFDFATQPSTPRIGIQMICKSKLTLVQIFGYETKQKLLKYGD